MTYLAMAFFFGMSGGMLGRSKGSSFFLWFAISAFLPVIGLLAAILYRSERDEPRRQCESCGKVVMLYDAVCTRCGAELDFPERAIVPESATT